MPRYLVLLLLTSCAPAYQGAILDIHAHVRFGDGDAAKPDQPKGPEPIVALDDAAGVSKSAIIVIARKGDMAETRAQNDRVIAAAQASKGRLFAIASVHPDDGDEALAEMERLKRLGVRVLKLHPNSQSFDVAAPSVEAVVRKAGELGLVLLFDAYSPWDANETGKFVMLAVKNPQTRFILAHLGGARFPEMAVFASIRKFDWYKRNVWFDLSFVAAFYAASPFADQLRWVCRQIGVDRLLFGSDFPVDTPRVAADAIRKLGFSADEQRQIFFDNANQLLQEH
jgi:uncharacterized protein